MMILFLKAQQRGARGRVDDLFGANPPLMDATIQVRGSVDKEGHVRKPHTRHVKVRAPEVAKVEPKSVLTEAAKPPAPKFQPTDEAMETAWNAMSQKERQNVLRYSVARMETPGGRLSAEAKRLADGAWSALPEDVRNNRSARLPVSLKAKQMAEREAAIRKREAEMSSRPPPSRPALAYDPNALTNTFAGVNMELVRVTKMGRKFWRVKVSDTGRDLEQNGTVFPGETKAEKWADVARTMKALGEDRFRKEMLEPPKSAAPKPDVDTLRAHREILTDMIEANPRSASRQQWENKLAEINARLGAEPKPTAPAAQAQDPVDKTGWTDARKAAFDLYAEYRERANPSSATRVPLHDEPKAVGAFKRRVRALAAKTSSEDTHAVALLDAVWTRLVGSDYDPRVKDLEFAPARKVELVAPAEAKPEHRYAAVNRPPGYATVPEGYTRIDDRPNAGEDHHDIARHGIVVYPRPLTDDEMRSYELRPLVDGKDREALVDQITANLSEYRDAILELADDDIDDARQAVHDELANIQPAPSIGHAEAFADRVIEKMRAQRETPDDEVVDVGKKDRLHRERSFALLEGSGWSKDGDRYQKRYVDVVPRGEISPDGGRIVLVSPVANGAQVTLGWEQTWVPFAINQTPEANAAAVNAAADKLIRKMSEEYGVAPKPTSPAKAASNTIPEPSAPKPLTINAMQAKLAELGRGYHDQIPLNEIFSYVRATGYEPVQEDGSPWSGVLTGADGRAMIPLTRDGRPTKASLTLSWHKMPSGRYEVTPYVSGATARRPMAKSLTLFWRPVGLIR